MYKEVEIARALELSLPIVDVRSPIEYNRGHIPNAYNIPLFSDEERADVGTIYKQISQELAYNKAYAYVEPKLNWFLEKAEEISSKDGIIIHCWRGGMRSKSFAKHLVDNGFTNVYLIIGGYKSFRNYTIEIFSLDYKVKLLGGFTGSGKTFILHELKALGQQVLDLEGLASHKGSAFGSIGQKPQPTTEMFENLLCWELLKLNITNPVWIEDECHNIGKVVIPSSFYRKVHASKLYFIDIPKEERAKHLVKEYGCTNISDLYSAIQRISKRLGPQNTTIALEAVDNGDLVLAAMVSLTYYDKAYLYDTNDHVDKDLVKIKFDSVNHQENAQRLLDIIFE